MLIPILSILLLSLQWVFKKTKTNFLRYTGYRNFINDYYFVQTANFMHYCCQKTLDYDTVYDVGRINYFLSITNSYESLSKFKSKIFQASKLSLYDFSTLYTTLPHHLIKDKLIVLFDRTFVRENTRCLACYEECAFDFHF